MTALLASLLIAGALGGAIAVGSGGWSPASAQQGITRSQTGAVGGAIERRTRQAHQPQPETQRRSDEAVPAPATDGNPPANPQPPTSK